MIVLSAEDSKIAQDMMMPYYTEDGKYVLQNKTRTDNACYLLKVGMTHEDAIY